jgi:hypothetical protein
LEKLPKFKDFLTESKVNESKKYAVADFNEGDIYRLDEVGDASSKPYSFIQIKNSKSEKLYSFTTASDEEYIVEFDYKDLWDAWEIAFDVQFGTGDAVVNKGEMYSVMATIANISLDFIKKVNPKTLLYKASKNFKNDNRREQLYLAYIKKLAPKWILGSQSVYTTLSNPK